MKTATKVVLISVATISAGVVWYLYVHTKQHYANAIINTGKYTGGKGFLMSLDKAFLAAWAKAAKHGDATFTIASGTFSTAGGKHVSQ